MMIKDMLLPLTSFPTPTEARSIETAVAFAKSLKAKVSAIAFEMNIESPIGLYADPVGVRGLLAADSRKSASNAHDLLKSFGTIATECNLDHDDNLLRAKPSDIPAHVVEEARCRDLTLLPLKEADYAGRLIAEQLIFDSGRPIVILPDDAKRQFSTSLASIAVAWDSGRAATRAVADAMPLLEQATNARIFTVSDENEKVIKKSGSASALAKHLKQHGIDATLDDVKSGGRGIGEVFTAYVAEHGIDLIVMGGYGHSRMREFILGGAMESMLSHPPTWVLMSH
jgi:nucleotide-binding universal stress UspA family protein